MARDLETGLELVGPQESVFSAYERDLYGHLPTFRRLCLVFAEVGPEHVGLSSLQALIELTDRHLRFIDEELEGVSVVGYRGWKLCNQQELRPTKAIERFIYTQQGMQNGMQFETLPPGKLLTLEVDNVGMDHATIPLPPGTVNDEAPIQRFRPYVEFCHKTSQGIGLSDLCSAWQPLWFPDKSNPQQNYRPGTEPIHAVDTDVYLTHMPSLEEFDRIAHYL